MTTVVSKMNAAAASHCLRNNTRSTKNTKKRKMEVNRLLHIDCVSRYTLWRTPVSAPKAGMLGAPLAPWHAS